MAIMQAHVELSDSEMVVDALCAQLHDERRRRGTRDELLADIDRIASSAAAICSDGQPSVGLAQLVDRAVARSGSDRRRLGIAIDIRELLAH
jgi:hypothetical protein